MIIGILIVSILLVVIGIYLSANYVECFEGTDDIIVFVLEIMGVIGIIGGVIALFILINDVKQLDIVDKKIQMYQEENNKIESDIDILVKQYIEYEQDTFKNAKQESSMVLVNLYPELKSNELVQEQIKVYTNNNYQIKKLKEQKLDYELAKWWLYFGKVKCENNE